jgi:hypothetical protein
VVVARTALVARHLFVWFGALEALRIVLLALIAQMLGTFLVFLVYLPSVAFQDGNPLMLTVEGKSCSRTWSFSPRQWSSGRRWTVPGGPSS